MMKSYRKKRSSLKMRLIKFLKVNILREYKNYNKEVIERQSKEEIVEAKDVTGVPI